MQDLSKRVIAIMKEMADDLSLHMSQKMNLGYEWATIFTHKKVITHPYPNLTAVQFEPLLKLQQHICAITSHRNLYDVISETNYVSNRAIMLFCGMIDLEEMTPIGFDWWISIMDAAIKCNISAMRMHILVLELCFRSYVRIILYIVRL